MVFGKKDLVGKIDMSLCYNVDTFTQKILIKLMVKSEDSQFWWVAGQFLYNKFIGYGRPAIAVRFEQMNADNAYNNKDVTYNRASIFLNYFIKGYSAWLAVGVDQVWYTNGAEDYLLTKGKQRNMTDFSTYFQFRF
ncbi:hypothetical protein DMNBHIDG_02641 [Candidatus Methanoperedenaceae archaeon GB37]|nr:hypothetical protein DMNBHIDG_02641 [Candidatus Methanoperedenaceae archaeon GB37]